MMKRFHALIFFVLIFMLVSCRSKNAESNGTVEPDWKKMPDGLMKKVMSFDSKKIDTGLFMEFSRAVNPDTLLDSRLDRSSNDQRLTCNFLLADLDGDSQAEAICIQGWDAYRPYLCVFKQKSGSWYLIYLEQIDTFYNTPSVSVAGNSAKNKTFYLSRVYNHGSGVYVDGYTFYKLVDNRVYNCLEIINDAHIYGWALYLNQAVTSGFRFNGDGGDNLSVRYTYNFFPGNIYERDCDWCANEDVPLIKGDDVVNYTYNEKAHQYSLDIPAYKNDFEDLTARKIACFGDFGNDSLFINAFRKNIDTALKVGTDQQKRILKKYISLAKGAKSGGMEKPVKKSRIGGTTFYRPK